MTVSNPDPGSNPLPVGSLAGKTALVTGSSRGVGAQTATFLAAAGADIWVTYRNKAARAERLVADLKSRGFKARSVGFDLTSSEQLRAAAASVQEQTPVLDLLILNASGGMETDMPEDYALRLNRDAQLAGLDAFSPLMPAGGRVVFVTSHQAHFVKQHPTMPEYEPVALSKRAGEDALRARIPQLESRGLGFVVISGDMIVGTVTATLLNRIYPGAIAAREAEVGKLYTVAEFAAEVSRAAVNPIPEDHTVLVGDTSAFTR